MENLYNVLSRFKEDTYELLLPEIPINLPFSHLKHQDKERWPQPASLNSKESPVSKGKVFSLFIELYSNCTLRISRLSSHY